MDLGTVPLEVVPWIRTGLRLVHFGGIILGVGAATLLDLIFFRFLLTRRIDPSHIRIIFFVSNVIVAGLVLLWMSGVGFYVYYWFFDPGKIANPKLAAKVIIVAVLTLNAFLVHGYVLPLITDQIGHRLLDGVSTLHSLFLIFIGTLSAASWYIPLVLGIVPQFNYTIPFKIFLVAYAVLILSANVILGAALVVIKRERDPPPPGPPSKTSKPRRF